ncbi:type IV pilus modification protein PilV [Nitrincola alkalilacustris]|uniref:type IV pilus modification protein PilV n=1 Tax=Nitrincola alkalilacustris TaxID=1571224 RepID=UPI00124E8A14|nr:type IV pilus modification protein PilV [Nitrincola alkalilacustris]
MTPYSSKIQGFTLLEVLITLLVLGIGLLGLAGLQARMLNAELEAYQRTHAVMLAEDMASRIKANPTAARNLEYSSETVYGTGSGIGDSCDPSDMISFDLCSWSANLRGTSTTQTGGENVGAMIGARGCIEAIGGDATSEVEIRVTVAWQGLSSTVTPSVDCGAGEYGPDDSLRRAVSITVMLAYLGV